VVNLDRDPYYDRKGRPIGLMDWARLHEDANYLIIAQHWVRGWMVSTVWLGIDHGFSTMFSDGPHVPVIFETMIFAPGDVRLGKEDWEAGAGAAGSGHIDLDEYQERYATEAAAQAGHDRALAAMTERLGGPAAAMEIMSAAQFSDTATAPDDPGELT